MRIALTEIFIKDLMGLQFYLQDKCRDMISSMKNIEAKNLYNQSLPGWRLHKLQSSPFISLSLDMNYRVLCKIEGDAIFFHRIVKHSLANSARINRNDSADTPFMVDNLEIKPSDIFNALISLGISDNLVSPFKGLKNEDQLLDVLSTVDKVIADYVLGLYETSGIVIPRTKYIIFQNDTDFESVLKKSQEEWKIYIHPSQQYIVNLPIDYRLTVCGSAGTGKTVCAWYRFQYLAQKNQPIGFVASNQSILNISKGIIEQLLENISTDCYFLIPNSAEELIQLAKAVKHIIIDEGQELTPSWYQTLGHALRKETTGITIFYDLNQLGGNYQTGDTKRYDYRLSKWNKGLEAIPNCQSMKLYINYRNSQEIARFYTETLENTLPESINSEIPVFSCGDVMVCSIADVAQVCTITAQIIQNLKSHYKYGEIGILCLGGRVSPQGICQRLELLKIPTTLDLASCDKILVTLPRIIRGYEKKVIIIVIPSKKYITKDLGKAINSYIALSRARDRLFVIEVGD